MTRIIEFLIALGIVAALFVIIGLCLPGERHITESIETNRKMTIVYDTINSLRRFKDWNPLVLHDKSMDLKLSGPDSGKGARLDYSSRDNTLGQGSWTITDSTQNERVEFAVDDPSSGKDKVVTFTLEPTGKDNRNVKITQDYTVDYGWNLIGRYAGLYVSRHVGDDMKLGLARMANMLASVPNFDYRDASAPSDLKVVDVPAEDLLVIHAGGVEIDNNNESIHKAILGHQEWIKLTMDANGLEPVGPVRIVTLDQGTSTYTFDVVQPVSRKSDAPAAAAVLPDGKLDVKIIPAEVRGTPNPATYVHRDAHRAVTASFTGTRGGLSDARNRMRAWAVTSGYEVMDSPYESWDDGVDKSYTQLESNFTLYWSIK